jgi:hypothetical protein
MAGWCVIKRVSPENETPPKTWSHHLPDHGSHEMGKGMERKIRKDGGLK